MKRIDDYVYLNDGTELDLSVEYGSLSITSEGDLASGYDDCLYSTRHFYPEHRKEIAEYMIQEWKKWGGIE